MPELSHTPTPAATGVLTEITHQLDAVERLDGLFGVRAPTFQEGHAALQGLIGGLTRADGLRRRRLIAIAVTAAALADKETA